MLLASVTEEYGHAGSSDANPDATTQIANGVSTTTYGYDNNGNLTSAGTSTFNKSARSSAANDE